MKKIRFHANVREEVRAIEQRAAMDILMAIHRYAATGTGRVKPLSGEFEGLLRLRVGNHRVIFDETEDAITIHRIRDRLPLSRAERRLNVHRIFIEYSMNAHRTQRASRGPRHL